MRKLALALACLAAVLSGCGPVASGPPEFQIGTGADAFGEVADGATLPIIEGGQGGSHVWVAGRSHGLADSLTPSAASATQPRARA